MGSINKKGQSMDWRDGALFSRYNIYSFLPSKDYESIYAAAERYAESSDSVVYYPLHKPRLIQQKLPVSIGSLLLAQKRSNASEIIRYEAMNKLNSACDQSSSRLERMKRFIDHFKLTPVATWLWCDTSHANDTNNEVRSRIMARFFIEPGQAALFDDLRDDRDPYITTRLMRTVDNHPRIFFETEVAYSDDSLAQRKPVRLAFNPTFLQGIIATPETLTPLYDITPYRSR